MIPFEKLNYQQDDEIRAIEMLQYIEPSRLSYKEWLRVGMALKNVGCSVMEWERWNRSDSRYKIGECEKKWASFTDREWNNNRNIVSLGRSWRICKPLRSP